MNPDPSSLDNLHDIVPPPSVPWWPPAPAWYWVLGALGVVAMVLLLRSFMHWQRNRYRREALAELARYRAALVDPAQRGGALVALSELLKRTAVTAFPRSEVASLTGEEWYSFLDRTGREAAFCKGDGAVLEAAAYDPRSVAGVDENKARYLAQRVRNWLAHHQADMVSDTGGAP